MDWLAAQLAPQDSIHFVWSNVQVQVRPFKTDPLHEDFSPHSDLLTFAFLHPSA